KLWEKEQPTPFCSIGDPHRLRALMPVPPDNFRLLREDLDDARAKGGDLAVTLRVQGRAESTWNGRISFMPESEAREVPVQLTNKGGGPLAVKPVAGKQGQEQTIPQSQQFLVVVDFQEPDDAICPGTLAQVKVHCKWR